MYRKDVTNSSKWTHIFNILFKVLNLFANLITVTACAGHVK